MNDCIVRLEALDAIERLKKELPDASESRAEQIKKEIARQEMRYGPYRPSVSFKR